MNKRHTDNPNIRIFNGNEYEGLPLLNLDMSENYLERIKITIEKAIEEHPRTLALRFDLRIPIWMGELDTALISRFLASLKAQIEADQKRRARIGKRSFPCTVRHIWAKEQNISHHWHYHVVIFLNEDAYYYLGDVDALEGNMAARINKAWASALGLDILQVDGLVEFIAEFHLDGNDPWVCSQIWPLFECASYLAKLVTKQYGNGRKNFSCSNY